MPTVTLRIDDALLAAIDEAAQAAHESRSAFIKRTLASAVEAEPAPMREPVSDDQDRVEFKLRMHRAPFEALRRYAAAEHILPSDIVRRLIHAHFYSGEIPPPYSSEARQAVIAVAAALNRIGTNIWQATNAVRRAAEKGDDAALEAAADDLRQWAEQVTAPMKAAERACYDLADMDRQYWKGEAERLRLTNRTRFGVT